MTKLKDLVEYTQEERRDWCRFYADPDGWKIAQANENRQIRERMAWLVSDIQIARENPRDKGCAEFLAALRSVLS